MGGGNYAETRSQSSSASVQRPYRNIPRRAVGGDRRTGSTEGPGPRGPADGMGQEHGLLSRHAIAPRSGSRPHNSDLAASVTNEEPDRGGSKDGSSGGDHQLNERE